MLRHPDIRYRPSAQLRALLRRDDWMGRVDPPMVPLMNALVARGIVTYNVCAEGSVSVFGTGAREMVAMQAIAEEIPNSVVGWNFEPDGVDFVRNGGPRQNPDLAPRGCEFSYVAWFPQRFSYFGSTVTGPAAFDDTGSADQAFLRAAEKIERLRLPVRNETSPPGRVLRDFLNRRHASGVARGEVRSAGTAASTGFSEFPRLGCVYTPDLRCSHDGWQLADPSIGVLTSPTLDGLANKIIDLTLLQKEIGP